MSAAKCTWNAVTIEGGIDGYNLYLKSGSVFTKVNTSIITTTTYTLTGLAPGTYSAYVECVKNENESEPSTIATFTLTLDDKYKPSGLSSTVTGSDVDLTWNYVPGIQEYNVYVDGVLQDTVYSNQYALTSLSAGSYNWYISSVYDGSEINSDTQTFTI